MLDLAELTPREQDALCALIDKRAVYLATGHGIAARALGVAIWLVWQVFARAEHNKPGDEK
jgi:hypothetical protein